MRTLYEQRPSGVIAPVQPAEPPPEHGVRPVIREALAALSEQLGRFEQTTHGCLGPMTIEAAAHALVTAYKFPSAYAISDLAQHIDGLVREEAVA